MINELCIHSAKQSFLWGTISWLTGRTLMLANHIESKQLLKVGASELWSSIHRNGRRKVPKAFDTLSQHRQAGAIARRIKGKGERDNAPGMRQDHEGQPTFPQWLIGG